MKFNEPIGSTEWAGLILRIPLGLFMLLAALLKIDNLEGFINTVKSFGVLKSEFANVTFGFLFPWIELFVSVLLILGLWVNLACIIGMILLSSIVYAHGLFGPQIPFNKDVILIFVLFALMFTGSGRLGVDFQKKS